MHPFPDKINLTQGPVPKYGQDFTSALARAAPRGQSVGRDVADLKRRMTKLLTIFAAGDTTGMAKRLFDLFLARQLTAGYFEDRSLNAAAMHHPHIDAFCKAAVGVPSAVPVVWGRGEVHRPGLLPTAFTRL